MPENSTPGVAVEENGFLSRPIQGVRMNTAGFAGLTRYGPVGYLNGPVLVAPPLITSFAEFERIYGDLAPLQIAAGRQTRLPYTAFAAWSFFVNGGQRLYVSRVFSPSAGSDGVAKAVVCSSGKGAVWRARWPGSYGNVKIHIHTTRSKNVAYCRFGDETVQAHGAAKGDVVEILPMGSRLPGDEDYLEPDTIAEIDIDPDTAQQIFMRGGRAVKPLETDIVRLLRLKVIVNVTAERTDVYDELGTTPVHPRYVGKILCRDKPEDDGAVVWFDWDPPAGPTDVAANLMAGLQRNSNIRLVGGNDGILPCPLELAGNETSDATAGLSALKAVEEIAIVALPDSGAYSNEDSRVEAAQILISHAEMMRYRIAVIDSGADDSSEATRSFRKRLSSKHAALYYPWIEVDDPAGRTISVAPSRRLLLPPSGSVVGVYARSDSERGVHQAPSNVALLGVAGFKSVISGKDADVLDADGINTLRLVEGRGNLLWGARTLSSDAQWKYVPITRLLIYLEHSIDNGTQWAVFEPNNEQLWSGIRRTVEDFLFAAWRNGMLIGDKPEEAYFVRCDRSTMTQGDIDSGRLVCLVGVATIKPAEFVIFRIGQWTADAGNGSSTQPR
jgi:uncharacterized protein